MTYQNQYFRTYIYPNLRLPNHSHQSNNQVNKIFSVYSVFWRNLRNARNIRSEPASYVEITGKKYKERFVSKCFHFPSAKHKYIIWGNLISPEDQGHQMLWAL